MFSRTVNLTAKCSTVSLHLRQSEFCRYCDGCVLTVPKIFCRRVRPKRSREGLQPHMTFVGCLPFISWVCRGARSVVGGAGRNPERSRAQVPGHRPIRRSLGRQTTWPAYVPLPPTPTPGREARTNADTSSRFEGGGVGAVEPVPKILSWPKQEPLAAVTKERRRPLQRRLVERQRRAAK